MSVDNIKASFNPVHLVRLMPFKATQDIRYYLCGICIEKAEKGVYLIATDGHTMAVAHDPEGTLEGSDRITVHASKELAAAAKKAKPIHDLAQKILVVGQRVRIAVDFSSGGPLESFVQPGDSLVPGHFPDWRKVLPDFSKLQRGAFKGDEAVNAFYVARCAQALGGSKSTGMSLWQEGPSKPIVVQLDSARDLIVILMPMHGDSDEELRTRFARFMVAEAA
jgi:DNA polymerase III sliding clamp (beta) subunit (PCNA family)